ncbi:Protein of unknown function [Cotesia congregata]|uniref:Uncharacterized protein n=1 Tax=Cotesia congregata TaxID=51543 RepID=A0A8J2HL70_COTCN|nr:Protein of unknown function [Cotesia congregata]
MFENVRPQAIKKAAMVLRNSEIYKHCNIQLDLERDKNNVPEHNNCEYDPKTDIHNYNNYSNVEVDNLDYNDNNSSDDDSDDEEPVNIEDASTLLITQAIVFAPGEGQIPVSLFDDFAESLSFVKIYGEYVYNENIESILKEATQKMNESNDENETNEQTPKNLEVFNDPSHEGDIAIDMEGSINKIENINDNKDVYYIIRTAETWIKAKDEILIEGYTIVHRVNVAENRKRHAYGLTLNNKKNIINLSAKGYYRERTS